MRESLTPFPTRALCTVQWGNRCESIHDLPNLQDYVFLFAATAMLACISRLGLVLPFSRGKRKHTQPKRLNLKQVHSVSRFKAW